MVGPSPRVRGSLANAPATEAAGGSIPACAGKPRPPAPLPRARRVHPRVCGEARPHRRQRWPSRGPSPRVRGSPIQARRWRQVGGSIPACAGKPSRRCLSAELAGVHPRVCGEAFNAMVESATVKGPSPRVRGSLRSVCAASRSVGLSVGSIPACAGKPPRRAGRSVQGAVHPRVCGEAVSMNGTNFAIQGPSPRVRGSQPSPFTRTVPVGSIPACAGKPFSLLALQDYVGVHPRVCGEAGHRERRITPGPGPSPRVRGSRRRGPYSDACAGSIPACAGKPSGLIDARGQPRVHPRVCGEARCPSTDPETARGPSPRVRGSRGVSCSCVSLSWVHPRVCGEAVSAGGASSSSSGPSPRVRGSRPRSGQGGGIRGSIPACAGKPPPGLGSFHPTRVHPRVCGEAVSGRPSHCSRNGPSPRVRGSRICRPHSAHRMRSIPACAGKPRRMHGRRATPRVHPRVCGEARLAALRRRDVGGPSPRVRGSPASLNDIPEVVGSIPACAGKPAAAESAVTTSAVHPRVCGEALALLRATWRAWGPSPRVRGSRIAAVWLAGLTTRVHPRVCGEALFPGLVTRPARGPSPLLRTAP